MNFSLSITAAPEGQHRAEGGIRFAVGFAIRNLPAPQGIELIGLFGGGRLGSV